MPLHIIFRDSVQVIGSILKSTLLCLWLVGRKDQFQLKTEQNNPSIFTLVPRETNRDYLGTPVLRALSPKPAKSQPSVPSYESVISFILPRRHCTLLCSDVDNLRLDKVDPLRPPDFVPCRLKGVLGTQVTNRTVCVVAIWVRVLFFSLEAVPPHSQTMRWLDSEVYRGRPTPPRAGEYSDLRESWPFVVPQRAFVRPTPLLASERNSSRRTW